MYGFEMLCEISKGTFEISHKLLNPYIEKYALYWLVCFYADLRYRWIVT